MKTEQLIAALVADVRPVRRLPKASERCARWLGLALALVAVGATFGGLRPDLAAKARDAAFLLENVALLSIFLLAARSAFELSVPDERRSLATFSLPLLALLLWLGLVLVRGQRAMGTAEFELAASTGRACVWRISGLGLLPAFASWAMLRRAAPLAGGWAGLFLFLSAFSLAALGTQTLCASDGSLHVFWWHCLPVLVLGLVGSGLGRAGFLSGSGRGPGTDHFASKRERLHR
jgi:hypothetical protein